MLGEPYVRESLDARASGLEAGAGIERVLFVCTGNVCRSPYMELVVKDHLTRIGARRIRADSAGTAALEGHEIAGPMAAELARRGIDPSSFRARQLSLSMVQRAGLIVTATRDHRRWVTKLDPQVTPRTFTLAQVGRLIEAAGDDAVANDLSLAEFVRLLNRTRGAGGAASSSDDIEDPWNRSKRVYRRVSRRIDEAIGPLASVLAGQI